MVPPLLTVSCSKNHISKNQVNPLVYHDIYKLQKPYFISVETDIWTYYKLKSYADKGYYVGYISSKPDYGTVKVLVMLTPEIIQILNRNGILHILCSRPIDKILIKPDVDVLISYDGTSVTFFTYRTQLLYITIVQLCNNFCWKDPDPNMDVFQLQHNNYINSNISPSVEVLNDDTSVNSVERIFSEKLQLNKLEVSYLIGKNGYWINFLRDATNATIKIIPILTRLNRKELNSPKNIFQTVTVTGTLAEVSHVIVLIESTLTNMRYTRS